MTPNNRLIPYTNMVARKVRGTDIKSGETLYAIQDIDSRLYFIWSYQNRDFAHQVSFRVAPDSASDIQANWRRTTGELCPTARKSD